MRHAGDKAPEARHFFLFDQPVLRLLQIDMRLMQGLIGEPQFADRPPGQNGADAPTIARELGGASHGEAFDCAVGG